MLLSLQELELRPVTFNVDIPAGEIEYDEQIRQTSSLHAEGKAELLNPSIGEVHVRGKLTVRVEAPCDRCLDTASFPVENSFDLRYFPADQFGGDGGEDAIEDESSDVAYYEGSRLDLNEILREVVLLALPMQLTCSETCKGICPTCGQNRNVQDCRCETPAVDDRWSQLKNLRAEFSPGH